jgi:hypothetical protein
MDMVIILAEFAGLEIAPVRIADSLTALLGGSFLEPSEFEPLRSAVFRICCIPFKRVQGSLAIVKLTKNE